MNMETTIKVCAQCEANARWNEAGGYDELAKECREYCRRGHKEVALVDGEATEEGDDV